jgi:hypothetical protein
MTSFPHTLGFTSYVLKLHRDARPGQGPLHGRLEHMASGERNDFASADGLVDWLLKHAARTHPHGVPLSSSTQEISR